MVGNGTIIRTGISVCIKWRKKIEEYANNHNLSSSDVMNILLEKQIKKMSRKPQTNHRAMKYQKRGLGYESMHLNISFVLYSRLRDVMFIFRVTLSYMLSMAMMFFDEFMKSAEKMDCYPSTSHSTTITDEEGMLIFVNYWGIPPVKHTITVPTG
ncbi:MAG: hypothetical protein PF637_11630 [Spirochaetes bacterium]|jgi:hypothetical protein|nr:hypothetical protein [Spirochaetota bacterium]